MKRFSLDNKFSPDNFKKWVQEHKDQFEPKLLKKSMVIGTLVESKIGMKKLINNVTVQSGTSKQIIKDFLRYGGTIEEVKGSEVLIKVDNGSFLISEELIRIQ
jgi:hypothetical protein